MAGNPRQVEALEINQVEDGFIIYQPEKDRVHFLNHTAVLVLELCDRNHSPEEIVQVVAGAYSLAEAPQSHVMEILGQFESEGLVAFE